MSIKKKLGMAVASLALGAMLIGGGTYALFTAEAKNEENTFSTGSLIIETVDASGTTIESPVFDVTNVLPGETDADHGGKRVITIHNKGTADAWVRVSKIDSGDHSEHGLVDGKYNDLFDGPFMLVIDYDDSPVLVKAGEKAPFEFGFTFPEDAGNEYQDLPAQFSIVFQAVQAKHNTKFYEDDEDKPIGPLYWSNDDL